MKTGAVAKAGAVLYPEYRASYPSRVPYSAWIGPQDWSGSKVSSRVDWVPVTRRGAAWGGDQSCGRFDVTVSLYWFLPPVFSSDRIEHTTNMRDRHRIAKCLLASFLSIIAPMGPMPPQVQRYWVAVRRIGQGPTVRISKKAAYEILACLGASLRTFCTNVP
jgi:hypothetical protein